MNSALAPSEKMTSSRRKGGSPDSKWCHTRQERGERQGVGGRAGWSCPRDKRALLRGIHRGSSQYLAHQSRKVDLTILLMHIEEVSCTTWPPTELEDLL